MGYDVHTFEDLEEKIKREVLILQMMKAHNKHCISLIERVLDNGILLLLMDFANGGSLESIGRCLNEMEIRSVIKKILKGLDTLQRQRVVHRDLN